MSFTKGFEKVASTKANAFASGTTKFIKDIARGVKDSGAESIRDTLKLKGLKHTSDAIKTHGGIGMVTGSEKGRAALAYGLGRSAPALAVAGLYGVGGKKLHDKIRRTNDQYGEQYHTYYGG